jgi:hypothetical protein
MMRQEQNSKECSLIESLVFAVAPKIFAACRAGGGSVATARKDEQNKKPSRPEA